MSPRRRPLLILLLAATLSASCATVIQPPAKPSDPEIVLLVTHGKSSSLILHEGDDATRWAYGDWRYYALGRREIPDALAAILWPTRAALGRQTIEKAPRAPAELVSRLGIGIDQVFAIEVSRESVVRLETRLQQLFAANLDTLLYNPEPRLEFVEHPQLYSLVSNSNGRVAAWLRELGCEVSGLPLFSRWRIAAPPSSPVRNGT